MTEPGISPKNVTDSAWLGNVREVRHPIDSSRPLWVRHIMVRSGSPMQPTVPYPERHPYCEFNYIFSGELIAYVGRDSCRRKAGDFMFIGPHTPHYAKYQTYPQRSVTIHFLPILLCEMGLEGGGAQLLARFTQPLTLRDRILRPPRLLQVKAAAQLEEMVEEFEARKTGSGLRLLALLLETMIDLIRWEESTGCKPALRANTIEWPKVEKALRFIQENHAETLYTEQIANFAGLTLPNLQTMFRATMGVSCVQYIRSYRISRAATLLCMPDARVTEVAFKAGFETLSHFNTSFRELIGMSPSAYIKSYEKANLSTRHPVRKSASFAPLQTSMPRGNQVGSVKHLRLQ